MYAVSIVTKDVSLEEGGGQSKFFPLRVCLATFASKRNKVYTRHRQAYQGGCFGGLKNSPTHLTPSFWMHQLKQAEACILSLVFPATHF